MSSTQYPVLTEKALGPARRRLLLGGRRETSELPQQLPGTVLVFEANGQYEAFRERRHLTGTEDEVVEAVSVSLVDVRDRQIAVDLTIPSVSAANDFLVQVLFYCKVTKPEAVVAAGLTDITVSLANYLSQDRELMTLAVDRNIEEINEVRRLATARATAYCTVRPPRIDGMSISLAGVQVLTPDDLRQQATSVRDELWRQHVEDLKHAFENRDVDRIHDLMSRGPEMITALGVSRGEIHTSDAAREAREAEDQRRKYMLELIRILPDGYLDSLPIDPMFFVDSLTSSIGHRQSPTEAVNGRHGANGALRSGGRDRDDEEPQVLDEDGFVG